MDKAASRVPGFRGSLRSHLNHRELERVLHPTLVAVPDTTHTDAMPADLLGHALAAKGFMPDDEGLLLHRAARERLTYGPVLEVGTYCGKSAIYL
jgi:predicted O-methyltransferase YrrM